MNDLMSLGLHRCWKETFVSELGSLKPQINKDNKSLKVLDVAGGTGDIAFKIMEKYK